jgi:probable rRNA maturation factor
VTVVLSNESGVTVDEAQLGRLAQFVLDEMGVDPDAELSVMLVDEPTMSNLHEQYMDEPGPTDVLAFPMDDLKGELAEGVDSELVGDVVLCPTVAEAQARDAGHDAGSELRLLCVHGVLHLLGYDHHEPEEEREMFGVQSRLLCAFTVVSAS